jgi:hypothetical protein
MNKDFTEIKYSLALADDSDAKVIVKNLEEVVLAAATNEYGKRSMTKNFSMDGATYTEKEDKVRKALLAFAASKSGITKLEDKRDIIMAFDNPQFVSVLNSIVSETLTGVVINANGSQLLSMCNVSDVEVGDSKTFTIEPKGLPIAQRGSYMNNVAFLDGYSASSLTVVPKLYTAGSSIDYIRILANGFDWGKELARVAMGMLYAQYKLVAGLLFDTTNVSSTPLYQATFDSSKYTLMIQYLQALNKTGVKAYGTLPAFQKQGTTATTNYGFVLQDTMIKDGYLGSAYGVDNVLIDQATDLSAPFVDANLSSLLLVPNNKILLVSDAGDKPVKLVRENFVRTYSKPAQDGALYRQEYSYTMSFDAAIITSGHYAIQAV